MRPKHHYKMQDQPRVEHTSLVVILKFTSCRKNVRLHQSQSADHKTTNSMCLCKSDMMIKSPRSPWRRQLREPMKPRLSRKIVSGARVNLNSYWAQLEELSKESSVVTFDLLPNSPRYSSRLPSIDNEVNENLANELQELGNK